MKSLALISVYAPLVIIILAVVAVCFPSSGFSCPCRWMSNAMAGNSFDSGADANGDGGRRQNG